MPLFHVNYCILLYLKYKGTLKKSCPRHSELIFPNIGVLYFEQSAVLHFWFCRSVSSPNGIHDGGFHWTNALLWLSLCSLLKEQSLTCWHQYLEFVDLDIDGASLFLYFLFKIVCFLYIHAHPLGSWPQHTLATYRLRGFVYIDKPVFKARGQKFRCFFFFFFVKDIALTHRLIPVQ